MDIRGLGVRRTRVGRQRGNGQRSRKPTRAHGVTEGGGVTKVGAVSGVRA